jgi:hypothetical protein
MATLDMNKAFPMKTDNGSHKQPKRSYDVRISLNKSGDNRPQVVRFGFINRAAQILGISQFIEASDIEYTKERVYFRTHDEKHHKDIHTLSTNSKTRQDSCYFAISPSAKAEKIYRMNWVGKTYPLLYDEENELYYIENTKD